MNARWRRLLVLAALPWAAAARPAIGDGAEATLWRSRGGETTWWLNRDVLRPLGYGVVDDPEGADLVVLNTCHIREKATEKVYSELGYIKQMKDRKAEAGGRMTIAVAGCVAQAEGKEIMHRQKAVDLVVGPQAYHQLPELIARAHRATGERLAADFAADEKFDALPAERQVNGVTAFLTVQEGCDKFCTFCVVPYTRGGEWSRPVNDIVEEAKRLAGAGVRERSEERRVGKECTSWCRSRWSPYH